MRIVDLEAIADALETAAGATTSANPNAIGRWSRIAAAAEALAGDTTVANPNLMGFMKRTAVALESIAGTDGTAENLNEAGYKKRIVDALEVQAGAVTAGSLESRMVTAAEDALWIELVALTLDDSSIAEDAAIGTAVGALVGRSTGSTLALIDTAGGLFALDGLNIEVDGALDFETATSHNITVRETLASASNSPRDSVIAITVTDVEESSTPTIDADTTFATTTGWTDTDGAGTSDIAITGGALVSTGGSGGSLEIMSANILNCPAPASVVNIQYEITASDNPNSTRVGISIGGGTYALSSSVVGVQTTAVTVGASDTILRIRNTNFAGVNWTMDSIAII
jgi:hypothetical protein